MEEQCALLSLPQGLLAHIISHLLPSLRDVTAMQLAGAQAADEVQAALGAWTCYCSNDQRELSHLKAARLFRYLAHHCRSLHTISVCYAPDRLYGGSLLDSSLGALCSGVPRLAHLTLLNVDMTDSVMHQLARHCPLLQHLAIGRTENNAFGNFVSDAGLTAVAAACTRLASLALFRCYSCSDAGLAEMTGQGRQLTSLVLHSCPQVTAAGLIKFIERTPGLQQLDVLLPESGPGAAVTFETCFALAAQCPGLKVLRLSEEQLSGGVLDDSCLSVIARGCTQLQELDLVQVEVTDAAMAVLAQHCTQLTSLRLEQTYVGDAGVGAIATACTRLQELRVAGCSTHSWMLPSEYMFAGLSVGGLIKMAAGKGMGSKVTSLDLSCLAYNQQEQQQPQQDEEPARLPGLLSSAAAADAVAAAASDASAGTLGAASPSLAASLISSSSSSMLSSSVDSADNSSSSIGTVASAIARLSLDGGSSSSPSSASKSKAGWLSGGASSKQQQQHEADDLQQAGCDQAGSLQQQTVGINSAVAAAAARVAAAPCQPLLPVEWCGRLTSLSLDWLKSTGSSLQGALEATLRCCSSLTALSLIGYQGDVDALLRVVAGAGAGAALTSLNLQHSQVTDAGLAVAARELPSLRSLYLSYCRLVGDTGLLDHVAHMQRLEELDLYNTPCVSAAAVARIARYSRCLSRLFIGHNTSSLNRTPAQSSAMGYISSGDHSKYHPTSSVYAAVTEAAASRLRGLAPLAVLCRLPNSDSQFERRTLGKLLLVAPPQ